MRWPVRTDAELIDEQHRLGSQRPECWEPAPDHTVGGCFVCFPLGSVGPGAAGDPGWAAAVTWRAAPPGGRGGGEVLATSEVVGAAGAPYVPGLLARREGPLLVAALAALEVRPDVVLVNGTGRDHPRRAGLALHLGAVSDLPTVGVTHRPLIGAGPWPSDEAGAVSPLWAPARSPARSPAGAGAVEQVGVWLRVRAGIRPLAVSPGWRTDLDTAVQVVLGAVERARTPEPLRVARRHARLARARAAGRVGGSRR